MFRAPPQALAAAVAGLLLAAAGAAWIAQRDLDARRAAFETEARIAHRLLSQRAVQHEAILATLALLQPGSGAEAAPEQRLPALVPQVQRVLRRDRDGAWPGAAAEAAVLARAETASRQAGRAVLAAADLAAGRYTLVRAAEPASFALQMDLDMLVPQASGEWTLLRDGAARVVLAHGAQQRVWAPGRGVAEDGGGWRFDFAKPLASDSQPFELRLAQRVGWAQLPWGPMLAWAVTVAVVLGALVAAGSAWQRQRSERRRARELLRLGQVGRLNALGELAAGMAHELNQPLTAVLASTQAARRLLDDDPPALDTARDAMAQAVQQARRASEVLGRLRRSVERPAVGAQLQPLKLEPALRDALDLLQPECRRLGVVPQLQCEPPGLAVLAEPVALEQIVHNLLSNALQALAQVPEAERRLLLRAAPHAGQVRLQVVDSGPGIAPEALPRLFEPFFSTRDGGLGLGLSLCESLAAGLGGSLSAHAAAPRGAEFRLDLQPATP
ncbi:sensor histidine kinase [Rubrivivax sp. RP6-9]|uniref:sensor histidine kinase n=1 Tax=Rubrivivax sp. RP6-9 TaxID=3415750 RepID=UPI003CC63F07